MVPQDHQISSKIRQRFVSEPLKILHFRIPSRERAHLFRHCQFGEALESSFEGLMMICCSLIFRRFQFWDSCKNANSKAFAGLVLSRLCSLWPIADVSGIVVHDV